MSQFAQRVHAKQSFGSWHFRNLLSVQKFVYDFIGTDPICTYRCHSVALPFISSRRSNKRQKTHTHAHTRNVHAKDETCIKIALIDRYHCMQSTLNGQSIRHTCCTVDLRVHCAQCAMHRSTVDGIDYSTTTRVGKSKVKEQCHRNVDSMRHSPKTIFIFICLPVRRMWRISKPARSQLRHHNLRDWIYIEHFVSTLLFVRINRHANGLG